MHSGRSAPVSRKAWTKSAVARKRKRRPRQPSTVPNNYPGCAPVGAVHARGSAERSPGQDFSAGSLRKGICSRSESSHPTVRAAEPERGPEQESGPHSKTLREALKWTRIPDGSGWAFYRRQRKGWSVGAWEREPHISSRVRRLRIRNLCAETVLN